MTLSFAQIGECDARKYRVRRIATVMIAISPTILCACQASRSGNWELFERSGSITTAIGLLVASRRYIRHGVLELAVLQVRGHGPDSWELLEDIVTTKVGLALSAFGTPRLGMGKYMGWWRLA